MELVRTVTAAGVTTLTLDSPANRNALSAQLMRELLEGLGAALTDLAVRVVVISHTGPVFCSGADLKETAAARESGTIPAVLLADVLAVADHLDRTERFVRALRADHILPEDF